MEQTEVNKEYEIISERGKLNYIHWIVLVVSLIITLFVFNFSSNQVKEKEKREFSRESNKVINLIKERMKKYEDGLLGGASCIQSHSGKISYYEWLSFSNSLNIDEKYPGISGIGVILNVKKDEIEKFSETMRNYFPKYKIYPEHEKEEHWPIVFIEPYIKNYKALGLDMAHEKNRFTALKKSCELKLPQITGPILLVQSEKKEAGFLFFNPYYSDDGEVLGIVYAPFIVSRLIHGALSNYELHVTIRVKDGDEILYSEYDDPFYHFDPNPIYSKSQLVNMYGRNWLFDISSNFSFREKSNKKHPYIILAGGIFIDIMLFIVFITLTKSNKNAITYADKMSKEAKYKNNILEQKNKDLETLLYVSSHDLREPIRAIKNFSNLIILKYKDALDEKGQDLFFRIERGANRMDLLLDDILVLSKAQRKKFDFESINCNNIVKEVLNDLENKIVTLKAHVYVSENLPTIFADKIWVKRAFFNLINNALKFSKKDEPPDVQILPCTTDGRCGIRVLDRGIGVKPGLENKIFDLFQRGVSKKVEGTGAGLAIVKQIALRHKGKVWVNSREDGGSEFSIVFLNKDLYEDE